MFRIALVAVFFITTNAVRQTILEKNNDHYSSKGLNGDASQHAFCRLRGTRDRGDSRRELVGKVYKATGWSFLKATGLGTSSQTNTESWTIINGLPKVKGMALTIVGVIGEYHFNQVNSCIPSTAPVNGVTPSGGAESITLVPVVRGKTKSQASGLSVFRGDYGDYK